MPLGALLDASHGNPQEESCSFFLVNNAKRCFFLPFLQTKKSQSCPPETHWVAVIWVQGANLLCHVLEIKTSLGNQGWTASSELWFGSTLLFFVLQWFCKNPEKTSGRKHQELLWAEGKHCQWNQLRRGEELKRFAPCCAEAGYSVSNHGCWADFSITIFVVAVRPEVHILTQRTLFLSLFPSSEWQLYLSKLPPSLPSICFFLLELLAWPVSLPFPHPFCHSLQFKGLQWLLLPLASASCSSGYRQMRSAWFACSSLSVRSIHSTQLWPDSL